MLRQEIGIDYERPPRVEASQAEEAEDPSNSTGSPSLGKPPLALRQGSATSAESLALAAAIANGMVLRPDPASVNSHRGKSPVTDDYPSPPPSIHGSPPDTRQSLEDEEGLVNVGGSLGSTGASSLPPTPSLIDSFPAIPFAALHMGPREIHLPLPLEEIPAESFSIHSSSRPARRRAGSTPDSWSTTAPQITQRHNSDLDQVWDVEEQEETGYIYPFSSSGLPVPGPPPSVPLPPEPVSPRLQPSIVHKHPQQLELDITLLSRRLPSTSSTSTGSTYPSTPDSSKILKKSASHTLLQREHSGMSTSSVTSSQGILSSPSGPPSTIPRSSSPHTSDAATALHSIRHNSAQVLPTFSSSPASRQRSTTDPPSVAPLKLRDKEKKAICTCKEPSKNRCTCRDSPKGREEKEKDREIHLKRRFFSKYASASFQMDKEAAALLASIADQDDSHSAESAHHGSTSKGFADDELSANIGATISAPEIHKEGNLSSTHMSPSSQRSPVDELSTRSSTSWTANNSTSPSEYKVQHILPPAEIIRLEKAGFGTTDTVSSRGRELKLGSPVAASPPTTSPLKAGMVDWNRRSLSTPRVDTAPLHSTTQTRSHRSGSVAATLPAPPSINLPTATSRHHVQRNSGAAKSANTLPLTSESKAVRKRASGPINPHQKLGMVRPMTTPSSPAGGFAPLSLPPPPRPRVRSLRSNNGESVRTSSASHRRPSIASSNLPSPTATQRPYSILKKPSFIDMGDDDGRSSLEDAFLDAASGSRIDDGGSHDNHGSRTPSVRSRSTTVSGWQPPDTPTVHSVTQAARGASYANSTDDSFLDMGKLSLDTIRSMDEEDTHPPASAPSQPTRGGPQYKHAQGLALGPPYGSIFY